MITAPDVILKVLLLFTSTLTVMRPVLGILAFRWKHPVSLAIHLAKPAAVKVIGAVLAKTTRN